MAETANLTNLPSCHYRLRSIVEERLSNGDVVQTTVKHYRVDQVGSDTTKQLLAIEGEDLSPEELEKENREEASFRRQFTHEKEQKEGPTAPADPPWAAEELLSRFSFRTEARETLNGRVALRISYQADPAANRGKSIRDRILREIHGQLWLDEEERELTRLELDLRRSVKVGFFGMLGALEGFSLTLDRHRVASQLWIDQSQVVRLDARKLFKPIHYHATETATNLELSVTQPES